MRKMDGDREGVVENWTVFMVILLVVPQAHQSQPPRCGSAPFQGEGREYRKLRGQKRVGLIADQSKPEGVKCKTLIKATIGQMGKIFPSSVKAVEEDERQPGQFTLWGWKVGTGSESSVINLDLPALGKATGKSRHEPSDLGLGADTSETEARAFCRDYKRGKNTMTL